MTPVRRLVALGVASALLFAAFVAFVRPRYVNWGATTSEKFAVLIGDDIAPSSRYQETRAITIEASVASVWKWLAQLGQSRGGFYSYDTLENLVGCEMPVVDFLRPGKDSWAVGDRLWMYPQRRAGGTGFAVLRAYEPGRALAFGTHTPGGVPDVDEGSWTFVLSPISLSSTRLIIRTRSEPVRPSLPMLAFNRLVFSPVHFIMERQTMLGLKELAETGTRSRTRNNVEVGVWIVGFGILIATTIAVIRRTGVTRWLHAMAAFIAAAMLFAWMTIGRPPLGLEIVSLVLPLVLLRAPWSARGGSSQAAYSAPLVH